MKNDRAEVARRELARAIEALTDGAGRETWGPGHVGKTLYWLSIPASHAFDIAASAIMKLAQAAKSGAMFSPAEFTEHMRRLAPPMLEVVLAAGQLQPAPPPVETTKANVFKALKVAAEKIETTVFPPSTMKALPPGAQCNSCAMSEASDPTLAVRKDGVLRCDSCSTELETALARGCECPGCRSVRAKRAEQFANRSAEITRDMFLSAAGLAPCPVIAPPMHCIGCGLKDTDEPSVHMRVDAFPRCNDCWRECGGA